MATISELATPHPVQVLPQTPVYEAARSMADLRVGDVIVTDAETGAVIGILTDRDIAVRVVARDLDPATTPVGEVCTRDVATIDATCDVSMLADHLTRHSVWRLPVTDEDGLLVGVVSVSDLATCDEVSEGELRSVVESLRETRRDNRA